MKPHPSARFSLGRLAWIFASPLILAAGLQAQLPAGTLLPVELGTSLDSNHLKTGQRITAKLRQEVPLPDRGRIPQRSVVSGHVVSVSRASDGNPAKLVFVFDRLDSGGRQLPISTDLRAVASMLAVSEAQKPANQSGFDSTVWNWNAKLIGGEMAFAGQMIVKDGADQVVGRVPAPGSVLGKARINPEAGCTTTYDNPYEQAFWVFSTDACGVYEIKDLMLVRPAPGQPLTQITLANPKRVLVRGGGALLLEVVPVKAKAN